MQFILLLFISKQTIRGGLLQQVEYLRKVTIWLIFDLSIQLSVIDIALQFLYAFLFLPIIGYSILQRFGRNWFLGQDISKRLFLSMLVGIYTETLLGVLLGIFGLLNQLLLLLSEVIIVFTVSYRKYTQPEIENPIRKIIELWRNPHQRFEFIGLIILALASSVFTLPFGVYSADTLRLYVIADAVAKTGSADFGAGLLGLTEIDPFANAIGAPIFTVVIFFHGLSFSMSHAYFVGSILISFLIGMASYEIVAYWFRNSSLANADKKWLCLLLSATYVFSELIVKFTGWAIMGRTFIFLFIPSTIILLLSLNENYLSKWQIIVLCALAVLNFLFHQTLIFTGVIVIIYAFIVNKAPAEFLTKRFMKIATLILVIEMAIPFMLYAIGEKALVWPWMIPRDLYIITDAFAIPWDASPIGTVGVFFSFSLWFLIRLGWLFPLAVTGYFGIFHSFNSIELHQKRLVILSNLSLLCIGFLMFRAMYFYQVFSVFFLVYACGSASAIIWVQERTLTKQPQLKLCLEWTKSPRRWFISLSQEKRLLLLILIVMPTFILETHRVIHVENNIGNRRYISEEAAEVAEFLQEKGIDLVIMTDYYLTSLKLSILLNLPSIPTDLRLLRPQGFNTSPLAINWPTSPTHFYEFVRRPLVAEYPPDVVTDWEYIQSNQPTDNKVQMLLEKYGIYHIVITNLRPPTKLFYTSLRNDYPFEYRNVEFTVYRVFT